MFIRLYVCCFFLLVKLPFIGRVKILTNQNISFVTIWGGGKRDTTLVKKSEGIPESIDLSFTLSHSTANADET